MSRHRQFAAAVLCVAALLGQSAWGDDYDPPAGYYDSATGTGTTLKSQLHNIIDDHNSMSYDAARSSLQVTDADVAHPGHMITVYDRESLNVAAINPGGSIPGWDSGLTWNREHTWPRSRGVGSSGPDDSDLFALRPALTENNGDRGNLNYGGTMGQSFGVVDDGGVQYYYPGDAEAGTVARQAFYMAVRYDGSDVNTTNLELYDNNPSTSQGMGNLKRLIEYHFAVPPDAFERRRNQIIYDDYQNNRNPFTDRPEYVWSVFQDQANNSRITINGATTDSNGGSTMNADVGRVFRNGAMPTAPTFTLNNTGNGDMNGTDGTYFEVTTTGLATSTIAGRYNGFRTGVTGGSGENKPIMVGLNANTSNLGQYSGTVTVNNLDVTTGGGAGRGANDANDTFNVSMTVLDHSTPSFLNATTESTLTINLGTRSTANPTASAAFDVFNRGATPAFTANMDFDSVLSSGDTSVLTTDAAALAGSLVLAGGAGHTFAAMMSTAAVGTFSATYTLRFSDENIVGAQNNKDITLALTGNVILAGDFNRDDVVDASDYIVWKKTNNSATTAYSGADADGSGFIDANDLSWWQNNFGAVVSGTGGGGLDLVPEPSGIALGMIGFWAAFCGLWRRHSR